MQITRQADYALRAMLYLARLKPDPKVDLKVLSKENEYPKAATSKIAEEKLIPPSFLAKIISQLSIAGLIHTYRGAHGGVSLARAPEEITVLEVVEAIDGPIALNDCTHDPADCPFGEDCPLRVLWCSAQGDLINRLRKTTFAQFVQQQP